MGPLGQWVRRARHDGKQYRRYTDAHIRAYQHLVRSAVEKVVRAAKKREFMGGGYAKGFFFWKS